MGHVVYRSWCPICVKAMGRDMRYFREKDQEKQVPEYSLGFCFPGDELGFKWTVLVGTEKWSDMAMATAVPVKGGGNEFIFDKCIDFIRENGDQEGKIIIKTDQENSIKCLVEDIMGKRPEGRTVTEESPVGSKGSNGDVERMVAEMEGQIRSLWLGLQARLGRSLNAKERIVAFIPEYAAYLFNRLHQGTDGKVPYERVKCKRPTVLGVEFGEKVFWKRKLGNVKQKLNSRWKKGIFVGVNRSSHEALVVNEEGMVYARDIIRLPVEQRWSDDCVNWVRWVPWHRYKGDEEADGDLPEEVSGGEEEEKEKEGDRVVFIDTKQKVPRKFYISTKDCNDLWVH